MHWDVSSRKNEEKKNDKLRELVKMSNPMVIGIAETKIDNLIGDSEISINKYCDIKCDRNKGGHVICYIINKIFYNTKNYISNEIENIFVEHLIPKTKPITI